MGKTEYYAGMFLLVPEAWSAEERYLTNAIKTTPDGYGPQYRAMFPNTLDRVLASLRHDLSQLYAGRELARSGEYTASFDDPAYGTCWRAHAKHHRR